jgi:hypothetical protein
MILLVAVSAHAFMTDPAQGLAQRRAFTSTSSSLPMAGFGSAPKKAKNSKKTDIKLKPKQQWDRYIGDLKGSESVRVGVKIIDRSDAGAEWMEVGSVKSKDDAYTEAAVIRHRVLIADHSRRLFPLQIFAKDKLEWGYMQGEEWVVAGKVTMPDDIDKLIGFEGLPDPSGFYSCNTERLVDNSVGGYAKMKKKGITGHVSMEVHD